MMRQQQLKDCLRLLRTGTFPSLSTLCLTWLKGWRRIPKNFKNLEVFWLGKKKTGRETRDRDGDIYLRVRAAHPRRRCRCRRRRRKWKSFLFRPKIPLLKSAHHFCATVKSVSVLSHCISSPFLLPAVPPPDWLSSVLSVVCNFYFPFRSLSFLPGWLLLGKLSCLQPFHTIIKHSTLQIHLSNSPALPLFSCLSHLSLSLSMFPFSYTYESTSMQTEKEEEYNFKSPASALLWEWAGWIVFKLS